MSQTDISQAKDPDLRGATAALLRAGVLARKAAMDSGTDLVIVKNGQIVFVQVKTNPSQLRGAVAPAQ